jgi:hypothetical protein
MCGCQIGNSCPILHVLCPTQLDSLVRQMARPTFAPLYHQAKQLLCCSWSGALYDLWLSWTVTGAVAAALCLVLSGRIFTFVRRPGAAGAAGAPALRSSPYKPTEQFATQKSIRAYAV